MKREHLIPFKRWLDYKGIIVLEPIGIYEVLRWEGRQGEAMPIIFRDKHGALKPNKAAIHHITEFEKDIDNGF